MKKELKILELFAGVGGFRIGFENANKKLFKTYWSNQWEPATKSQDAFEVYNYQFPDSTNINEDIAKISNNTFKSMDADIIVGGFPCQDYSVAKSKAYSKGIEGKKGVLFWEIIRATKIIKPEFLILENVDRLLKSPASQRGRDFAIMLSSFNKLGYCVEWRVINAAEYGMPQRRRRVYFFIYSKNSKFGVKINSKLPRDKKIKDYFKNYLYKEGIFARQFKVKEKIHKNRENFFELPKDILEISDSFTTNFWNSGIMINNKVYSIETEPIDGIKIKTLGEILQPEKEIEEKYFIKDKDKLNKFKYLRGGKKIERTSKEGHKYLYSEGSMSEFDDINLPSRTMLTSEGTLNRSTHLLYINKKFRLLTPIEAERLQCFPDNWTLKKKLSTGEIATVSDSRRMFFMGNALVTDIIEKIANEIEKII